MFKRVFCVLIIVLNLTLVSCKSSDEVSFKEVVGQINHYNDNIKVPDINMSEYINELDEEEMLTWDEFNSLFSQNDYEASEDGLDKEAAKADIEIYFKALRTNYTPYSYFGGDELFNKAKNETLSFIDSKDKIFESELVEFLANELSFVKDKHFHIASRNTIKSKHLYMDEETKYLKDEDGYYQLKNNKKYYIKTIDGSSNIEENIKPSIEDKGELSYKVYKIIEGDNMRSNSLPVKKAVKTTIAFDGNDERQEEVTMNLIGNSKYKEHPTYEYEEKDSISIVTMRAMVSNDDEVKENFIDSAVKTKNSKITILDLRDNQGGDGTLPVKWIEKRFDTIVKSNSKGLYVDRIANMPEQVMGLENKEIYKYFCFKKLNNYFYTMEDKGDDELVENKNYIFVLIDNSTGSSGELFIDLLRRIENVIVVGTNSVGVLSGSLYGDLKMPNTGIEFGYGNWLRVYDDEVFEEGRGFMPDILIDDDEAMDKVLSLIDYYNLD